MQANKVKKKKTQENNVQENISFLLLRTIVLSNNQIGDSGFS